MDKQTDLISRLQDEADLCRNDGADDIAALLDEAVEALRDRNHDTQVGEKWREDSRLETWFPLTAERLPTLEAEVATLKVTLHHAECAAAAAEEDRDELLAHLSALVDRCAFDGVPNDSLPVWQAAHDAVADRKRA